MFLRNLGSTYEGKVSHVTEETEIKTFNAPCCCNYSQMQAVTSSGFSFNRIILVIYKQVLTAIFLNCHKQKTPNPSNKHKEGIG